MTNITNPPLLARSFLSRSKKYTTLLRNVDCCSRARARWQQSATPRCCKPFFLLVLCLFQTHSQPISALPDHQLRTIHDQLRSEPKEDGEITHLPGYKGELPSRHFGGYVTVDAAAGRRLYYYLVESQGDPSRDPVVLWLNGGPGCSSFDGFIYEHGPFLFSWADSSMRQLVLHDNPWAWSRVASVIYLDSPAAVGLSFSDRPADYTTNDTATAADAAAFLAAFFTRHPRLASNDFFIAGESYAGIYVPMLAAAVVEGNRRRRRPAINIKGYLVGNGCTDPHFDGNALPPFAAGHSLISADLHHRLQQACGERYDVVVPGSRCEALLAELAKQVSGLNLYNILEDCHHKPKPSQQPAAPVPAPATWQGDAASSATTQQALARVLARHRSWPVTGVVPHLSAVPNWRQLLGHDPPCTQASEAEAWLNDPAVRAALHAAPAAVSGPWTLCSDRIAYTSDGGSMLPVHRHLTVGAGLRALIYSGDVDMCVPHTGSEAWTAALHRTKPSSSGSDDDGDGQGVRGPWRPWFSSAVPRQVAGYVVDYASGLTYATIKGAGHMVPQTRPREALDMFSRFISGEPLSPLKDLSGVQTATD